MIAGRDALNFTVGKALNAVADGAFGNEDEIELTNAAFAIGDLARQTIFRRSNLQVF